MIRPVALIAAFLQLALAHFSDTLGNGFVYSATLNGTNAAVVCISGKVPLNTYIGLGIPANASAPEMRNADLSVAFAASDTNISVLLGVGGIGEFVQYSGSDGVAVIRPGSKYDATRGILTACFERSLTPVFDGGNALVIGGSG
ncbi:hypothetical protein HDU84_003496 [Entophlyctis sp. JEL0112]|nr:hypothetical protein HDU84_003496 [Entophlyctis sp. JEL0112]